MQAGVVDVHDFNGAHVVKRARLLDVLLDAPSQLFIGAAQQRRGLADRKLPTQCQRQCVKNSAVKPVPQRAKGSPDCVVLPQPEQAHPRHIGVQPGLELEEIQTPL